MVKIVGVILNLLLFAGKFLAGRLSGSVSVMADAFNNLTDAGTVCLASLGVKVASLGPGQRHPDGHGKFEWIIALITSMFILLMGLELLQSSVAAIKSPGDTVFSWLTLSILLASIVVKVFLYFYNSKKSRAQGLLSLKSVALDSLCDAVSTFAVLCSLLFNHWFQWQVDGWFGFAVALLILYNAVKSISESVERLMGEVATPEELDALRRAVRELCPGAAPICGVQIDDYGCGRRRAFFSLLPREGIPAQTLVETVPLLAKELHTRFGYDTVIEVEQPLDAAEWSVMRETVQAAMEKAGYPCELIEFRVLRGQDDVRQVRMTVLVSWWEKAKIEALEAFLKSPANFGLAKTDSVLAKVRLGHAQEEPRRSQSKRETVGAIALEDVLAIVQR
ncbi:putative cation efflux protein [Oscillibacter valericigenes Sjm18-20]|nr:putative cation efflux protein [Oscillibacter valericigenes Sjm18-20]